MALGAEGFRLRWRQMFGGIVRVAALLLVVGTVACVEPTVTKCPSVDCPPSLVCDNRGGCALAEQFVVCAGLPG